MSTATATMRRNQNFTRSQTQITSGPLTIALMLISLVILLSLLYLSQVTKTSTFNYRISTLSQTRDDLQAKKEKLQIDAARLQSIAAAKQSAATKGMVAVDKVTYADQVK